MGHLSALDMAQHAPLETAISWHLTSNHYPPLPTIFIPTCLAAISAGQAEDWDFDIPLPVGVEWKDGRTVVRAGDFIDSFHLEAFL